MQVDSPERRSLLDAVRQPQPISANSEESNDRADTPTAAKPGRRARPRPSSGRRRRLLLVVLVLALLGAAALERLGTPDLASARGTAREAVRDLGRSNALVGNALDALGFRRRTTPGQCDPGDPIFLYGFAELKLQIGSKMGEPLECEHAIHPTGDTHQRTTTGLAYYRKGVNIPTFTNGWDHWALTKEGLLYWTGDVVDPPTTTPAP